MARREAAHDVDLLAKLDERRKPSLLDVIHLTKSPISWERRLICWWTPRLNPALWKAFVRMQSVPFSEGSPVRCRMGTVPAPRGGRRTRRVARY
jgi:hypothetical protein